MIKFWFDLPTLSHRYMETVEGYDKAFIHVVRSDGNVEQLPRYAPLDTEKYSRVVNEPQELLDALIAAGFKPNKLEGTPGHVEALKQHIAFAERVVDRVLKK